MVGCGLCWREKSYGLGRKKGRSMVVVVVILGGRIWGVFFFNCKVVSIQARVVGFNGLQQCICTTSHEIYA